MTQRQIDNNPIRPQEKKFVRELVTNGFNTGKALKTAGYECTDSSLKYWQLMKRPRVLQALQKAIKSNPASLRRNPEFVLDRLEHIITICSDQDSDKWDPKTVAVAAKTLGQYYKLFTEKVEIEIRENLGDKIREARDRERELKKEMDIIEIEPDSVTTITETNSEKPPNLPMLGYVKSYNIKSSKPVTTINSLMGKKKRVKTEKQREKALEDRRANALKKEEKTARTVKKREDTKRKNRQARRARLVARTKAKRIAREAEVTAFKL